MRAFRSTAAIEVFVGFLAAATSCRRPEPVASVPLAMKENYCWWAVFRTTLPPDSVAVHFVDAFRALGLRGGVWAQRGDTVWAHAEPTALTDQHGALFSARVVAYRTGDSTHFRHFVSVAPPPGGWPASYDSLTTDGRQVAITPSGSLIGFCGTLGRTARVHGTAPANPDGEEKLELWTRTQPEE
jgi:hypothetical protein